MSPWTASVAVVDEEDVACPFCREAVLTAAEGVSPCRHTLFVYSWDQGGFLEATPEVEEWWSEHERTAARRRLAHPDELAQCPFVQELVQHNSRGMACGPVCLTLSFGFSKRSSSR